MAYAVGKADTNGLGTVRAVAGKHHLHGRLQAA